MGSFPVLLALASLLSLATPVRAGDEPDELMPGRRIVVQPGKLLRVVAKPPIGVTFDLPDAANDPTVEGATLHVFDESSPLLDEATFALPATGWTALRSAGFRYRGAGSPGDPCRIVVVRRNVVRAVCKGPGVTVTGPVGGAVGVVVDVGQTSKRYCASFGGQEQRNDAETIRRRNAPAPGVCPVFTPSTGPTTTTTSTTIIVEDPFVCCAVPGEARCFWMFLGCPDGSVQGEAGSHCDGATGACVTTPPSGGDCCDNTMVPQSCSGGPGAAAQCALPGVLVPNAICYAGSTGCITVTSTTSSSTTSTTAP